MLEPEWAKPQLLGQGYYARVVRQQQQVYKGYWPWPQAERICSQEVRSCHWLAPHLAALGLQGHLPARTHPLAWTAQFIPGRSLQTSDLSLPEFAPQWRHVWQRPNWAHGPSLQAQAQARYGPWVGLQLRRLPASIAQPLATFMTAQLNQLPSQAAPCTWLHGDCHLGNWLWHEGRIQALIDPFFSQQGHLDWDLALLLSADGSPALTLLEGAIHPERWRHLLFLRMLQDLTHQRFCPWLDEDYWAQLLGLVDLNA